MIPKKIHYCWFGRGEKPKLAQKCIASWKKYCPDYEIIEWNEDNFDVGSNAYTKMCYENRKFAFLTDYLRLLIIRDHGGIYFDTDVEVIKSFDSLLDSGAFFGFENKDFLNTGEGFGAEAGNPVISRMIDEYEPLLDGQHGTVGCPILNTQALSAFGFRIDGSYQEKNGVILLPQDYLNPYDDPTGVLSKTKNTYSIHWYGKSWMSKTTVMKSKLAQPIHRLMKRRNNGK